METPDTKIKPDPVPDQKRSSLITKSPHISSFALLLRPILGILIGTGLVYGGYWYGLKTKPKTSLPLKTQRPEAPSKPTPTGQSQVSTPVETPPPIPQNPSTTQQDIAQITIPPDWITYSRRFIKPRLGGISISFQHPQTHYIYDDSEPLLILRKDDPYAGSAEFNVLLRRITVFQEYQSGSRRVWFLENLQRAWPEVDFSGLRFEEINFSNAKRYLKVKNWPMALHKQNLCYHEITKKDCSFYFGIQNGISFYFLNHDENSLSEKEALGILYTLEVAQ